MPKLPFYFLVFFFSLFSTSFAQTLCLKENLQRARPGDYIVMVANKTVTLMHIYSRQDPFLIVEEIAAPFTRQSTQMDWKSWIRNGAPGHNSWVMYEIDLRSGRMERYYSLSKGHWYAVADVDNFLSKLLNLRLQYIPEKERRKVGVKLATERGAPLWQPPLKVEGQTIRGILFDGWRTRWPKDGSDLSGKIIEIYLPQDSYAYPAYFPYWLQIQNSIGKSRVRIIDSGTAMQSPKPPLLSNSATTNDSAKDSLNE